MFGPLRRLVACLLPALLATALISGCGSEEDNKAVTDLLNKAFKSPIGSADVKLDIELELDGIDELDDPIQLTLAGPYESGGDTQIPSVDWDITVSAQSQSFNAGLLSTGDRAFVSFQGTDYEVSQATVEQLNRQIAENEKQEDCDFSEFGVKVREWVTDAGDDGDEDVAGAETTHVSGKLDVATALDDLNKVVSAAASCNPGIAQATPPEITEEQRNQIEEVIEDPRFDAYVGKDDGKIHRLSADLEFEVPEDSRDRVGGLEGGRLSFSIEFANIGTSQTFQAPDGARPIEELANQLRGLLGGALGGVTPPGGTGDPAPQSDPEKQQAYDDCVKTDPSDPQVKAFCEVLLQ